ncbi:YALI0E26367p [Yarrowia lipolytica CLIB122]|uniref:DNA polymerase epsilon catalytic subunit A n=2 Tax=Yarrowia lipolytica TaxID=4952 RepID=DPOE_YARLI|nr:YALI0E26367p [Yarrowia lipolytica CLIB122]Q6C4J0.1 RecName: Full=DNA polymerase epsilon catalytic subunit A; AltName: Full=DNA polymerase II subunit A [Yarrowia lipolytica CLIB122]AOW05990.1 hypothetical protein YALI1_E31248g [Yarrowia lipolytica]KAB8280641.1 DNA polymerase epsilon catalytic subunit A [Yarrowia lipolytica]KAE8170536.1 DNA polymerase epsilon catalytic subunit A [Yarrowia lipolytica]KAJ8057397.1 DNA polymerase epsilon catalytic subunit A [Yarrowia lipolytica]QNP99210.1 DNA p|eukprot:XP_504422.1 YALI0E26367p [Yarrowia lipolytica CLIB122]
MGRPFNGNNTHVVKQRSDEFERRRLERIEQLGQKFAAVERRDAIDDRMGFTRFSGDEKRVGWLVNMHETLLQSETAERGLAAVDYYFYDEEGGNFKSTVVFRPYFFVICKPHTEHAVKDLMEKMFERVLASTEIVTKEDLNLTNHLTGKKRKAVKLEFHNSEDLSSTRFTLSKIVDRQTQQTEQHLNIYELEGDVDTSTDVESSITGIKEFDVPFETRVAIDLDIRVGNWYEVTKENDTAVLKHMVEREYRADPVVMAYDIETEKAPLRFPDSAVDRIMMISYMIDGEGFLITNREMVSEDIEDFEYTPKPEFPGNFTIFNEPNEKAVLEKWFEHIRDVCPTVMTSYNGDFFDFPFIDKRTAFHGMNLYDEIGWKKVEEERYECSYCVHMDCLNWVKRDSYLPQGSQGLKAVTKVKLSYDPKELDPEKMTPYARDHPQILAEYSVSDAVATYYLYMKYVHPFIFSLCCIIPLNPDAVLRKGTGTLCEMLLMVKAYEGRIILPDKHKPALERHYKGHLVDNETYTGGHVESLAAGVFRSDIMVDFDIDTNSIDELLVNLDETLEFCVTVEAGKKSSDFENLDEVRDQIIEQLQELKSNPKRSDYPLIYHVDVASMYPNIMTTNRLQPDSMVDEKDCAVCDYNRPDKTCARELEWARRVDYYPVSKGDVNNLKQGLVEEYSGGRFGNGSSVEISYDEGMTEREKFQKRKGWAGLSGQEQANKLKERVAAFSLKTKARKTDSETTVQKTIVCQRENPFYVDVVQEFKQRRIDYKTKAKRWNKEAASASDPASREEAKKMAITNDSMQLAHKVILNSFYGYVMRKGSRWYSMEMAGVTCYTGAKIIKIARQTMEGLGIPLELDTDGIWCMLPKTFPEKFKCKFKDGSSYELEYPCSIMNYLVHRDFTNHQYQKLNPETGKYDTHSENSIFFELDGPYKCMMMPTSTDKGKGLKKRYVVFDDRNKIVELKGFEVKRRGELSLIKKFQSQLWDTFLEGSNLVECYAAQARVAEAWLAVIDSRGKNLSDEELIDLVCENKSMSKPVHEYGSQKSTALTTARRLAEIMGDSILTGGKLSTKYIIAVRTKNSMPVPEAKKGSDEDSSTADRAIPTLVFETESLDEKLRFLKRWMGPRWESTDPRDVIDWMYYRERLATTINKLVVIPAILLGLKNPVRGCDPPEWASDIIKQRDNPIKQSTLSSYFVKGKLPTPEPILSEEDEVMEIQVGDIESIGTTPSPSRPPGVPARVVVSKRVRKTVEETDKSTPSLPHKAPDPFADYAAYIKYAKVKWKHQKAQRDRRAHLFGESDNGIASSWVSKNAHLAQDAWHLVSIHAAEKPGQVEASVIIGDKMQRVQINVPRKVYVGSREPLKWDKFTDVTNAMAVAEEEQPKYLYRAVMSEDMYQTEMTNPESPLKDPHVTKIYEADVSPDSRALIELGSTFHLDASTPGILSKGFTHGFEAKWFKSGDSRSYLQNSGLSYAHIVHVVSSAVEIFVITPTWDAPALVFVHQSSSSEKLPDISKEYARLRRGERYKQNMDDCTVFSFPDTMQYEVEYCSNHRRMLQKVSKACDSLSGSRNGQLVFALHSPDRNVDEKVAALARIPCIRLRPVPPSTAAVGWQRDLVRRLIASFLSHGANISYLVEMARYAKMPLCHVQDTRDVIDVSYARRLIQNSVVLWWSAALSTGGALTDQAEVPVANNPGLYTNICFEIKIEHLVLNALLQSAVIQDTEGDIHNELLSNAFNPHALKTLKMVVKEWWEHGDKKRPPQDLLDNFTVWVYAPESRLFSPQLLYHTQNLTKKTFLYLAQECRKHQAQLVYADQHKLVLQTEKTELQLVYSYSNYIVRQIRTHPILKYVSVDITRYWDTFLWMDKWNYGGYSSDVIVDPSKQSESLLMHWHIANFLPETLQQEFSKWVQEYIHLLRLRKYPENRTTDVDDMPSDTPMLTDGDKDDAALLSDKFFGKGVVSYLHPKLVRRVKLLAQKLSDVLSSGDSIDAFKFPVLPGSMIQPETNPVVEFAKYVCHIYGINAKANFEVQILLRDLLNIFDINEFSEEGTFRDPSMSLKLTNMMCFKCKNPCDLDLCKDSCCTKSGFRCPLCNSLYDMVIVEQRLVGQLQRMILEYETQDFRCDKCRRVKEYELTEFCPCSGSWVTIMSAEDVHKELSIYDRCARWFELKMLGSFLRQLGYV